MGRFIIFEQLLLDVLVDKLIVMMGGWWQAMLSMEMNSN